MSVEALGLDREQVRRVTVYFSTADKEHALQFATLSEAAGAYFEREFGASFPLRLAVLSPEDWFDPYPGGDSLPYGMPWGWVDDLLMTAPASLDTGVLIFGPDRDANRQRVEFVLLHEFGHLASKQYLHPDGPRPYSSVKWFEEFLATYFAYAYVRTHDPEWAEASRKEWLEFVRGYSPAVISLDWSFMQELPPGEFARTYAWYQNLLNLRVVDVYDRHGLNFLRTIGEHLPWEKSGNWTNESVLRSLDEFAPGFEAWAGGLEIGDYLPAVSALDEER
ncbi:MAG: hypothetical protein K8J08_02190 [Thermoanaerobaculia bacterium]|nr:hypothetical protein [Thermoanaerobaculia bacterium]